MVAFGTRLKDNKKPWAGEVNGLVRLPTPSMTFSAVARASGSGERSLRRRPHLSTSDRAAPVVSRGDQTQNSLGRSGPVHKHLGIRAHPANLRRRLASRKARTEW